MHTIDKDCSIDPAAQQVFSPSQTIVRLICFVPKILLDIADDFVDTVTDFACQLAKHRNSSTLETKDLKLCLEKHWGIHIPGFGERVLTQSSRPPSATHEQVRDDAAKMDYVLDNLS